MNIIFIDDERSAHVNFRYSMDKRSDVTTVEYSFSPLSALSYAKNHPVDCAFLDLYMPEMSGIQLATELKAINPAIEIVFISGYDDFAREAYKVGARAYLSKPYTEEELSSVLAVIQKLIRKDDQVETSSTSHVYAKTFGYFDLFVDGLPVSFKTAKAKELLAFLIDLNGGTATSPQIFLALWDEREYTSTTSTYVRRTVRALKDTLTQYGIDEILDAQRNSFHIVTTHISCDYYQLLQGDTNVAQQYGGQYMHQYSWAEPTVPVIDRTVWSMGLAKSGIHPPFE